ncbi:unnamed protein product [Vitrella brassicaformis CCMP3155]|uniref:Cyclic nucleotide-binding domain-containing protein n=1 Tax=Vitrella brassicaformis (strain CCMP3155) TaxID=1169540 RepID=A0A0G4GHL9_VITBC|nr:unnamed protein product [Vitrella brassicaformis CCMP3155]|eukprot:CEM29188.1 unnamed protein product [Vitrella brassicaformis CCMP3155]
MEKSGVGASGDEPKSPFRSSTTFEERSMMEDLIQENIEIEINENAFSSLESPDLEKARLAIPSHFLIISPDSTFRVVWDLVGVVFILYQTLMIPFLLSFSVTPTGGWYVWEWFVDSFFISDIFLNFVTGYYDKGHLIMKQRKIAYTYSLGWCLVDTPASFPYEFVYGLASGGGANSALSAPRLLRFLRFAKMFRVLRLLRVLKLNRLLFKIEEHLNWDALSVAFEALKLGCIIVFLAHWSACCFFAIGRMSERRFDSDKSADPGENTSWLIKFHFRDKPIVDQYVASVYWTLTTVATVGLGDVVPTNTYERIYANVLMVMACGTFAMVVGNLTTVANRANEETKANYSMIKRIVKYMNAHNCPRFLKYKVKRYLEFVLTHSHRADGVADVLELLSPSLKTEMAMALVGRVLTRFPLFAELGKRFLRQVAMKCHMISFAPGDVVCQAGQLMTEMYFVISGRVQLCAPTDSDAFLKGDAGIRMTGSYFNEASLFDETARSSLCVCRTFCNILVVDRADVLSSLEHFPALVEKYENYQERADSNKASGMPLTKRTTWLGMATTVDSGQEEKPHTRGGPKGAIASLGEHLWSISRPLWSPFTRWKEEYELKRSTTDQIASIGQLWSAKKAATIWKKNSARRHQKLESQSSSNAAKTASDVDLETSEALEALDTGISQQLNVLLGNPQTEDAPQSSVSLAPRTARTFHHAPQLPSLVPHPLCAFTATWSKASLVQQTTVSLPRLDHVVVTSGGISPFLGGRVSGRQASGRRWRPAVVGGAAWCCL